MSPTAQSLVTARLLITAWHAIEDKDLMQWAERYSAYLQNNAAFFAPTDPPRSAKWGTPEDALARLRFAREEAREGRAARWFLALHEGPPAVIGHISLTQIARGPFCSAMLGYALDQAYGGRGLMYEALEAVISHAFNDLALHRVQANYLPDNLRSARVLQRLGFAIEGRAKDYLFINRAWRDHVLTARLNPAMAQPVT